MKLLDRFRSSDTVNQAAISLLILAIITSIVGYSVIHQRFDLVKVINDFYANVSAELASIAITVIVIDRLNKRREDKQRIQQLQENLIMSSGSLSNEIAKDAVHQIRRYKWLYGKINLLAYANLVNANLRESNLWRANLYQAKMWRASLQDADLRYANMESSELYGSDLRGTNLYGVNLTNVKMFISNADELDLPPPLFDETTVMPDGNKWNKEVDIQRFLNPKHPEFWQPTANDIGWLPDWYTDSNIRNPSKN